MILPYYSLSAPFLQPKPPAVLRGHKRLAALTLLLRTTPESLYPILLSILIALPFALLNLHFPSFVNKAIGSVANTATPLALISIGASFEGKKALKKMKPTLLASFIKLILLAGLFLPLAVFFGYRNQELMALLVMLGSPTTVSSYIMAKNTGNDGILTSSIIVLTTLLSSLTLTLWIFVLKSFGVL